MALASVNPKLSYLAEQVQQLYRFRDEYFVNTAEEKFADKDKQIDAKIKVNHLPESSNKPNS